MIGEYDSTGTEIKTYGWAPGSQWSSDPLYLKVGGVYYWYRNDHLGTPQKITTTSGAVVWSAVYDSFGNCQIGTETITNNLRGAGQYFDAETGLYYNYHRYYDPTIGRYLRTDPFGQGLNLYAYCFNNPHSWIDPLGLCAVEKTWDWWSDVAMTTGEYWGDKAQDAWDWFEGKTIPEVALSAYLAFEHFAMPIIVGHTAIIAGVVVESAGIILAGAGVVYAIPTFGISLITVPIGLGVAVVGQGLINFGVNIHTKHINNLFGTNIPSWSDHFDIYPRWPARKGHSKH